MKKLSLLLLVSVFFISCKGDLKAQKNLGKIHNVSVADFQKAINLTDATLVDVRTPEEYNADHIEGAINVNWKKRTFRNYILNIPQDKPILIYCRTGNRTSKTAITLQSLGYKNIYNLDKGIKQWKLDNVAVTKEDTKKNTDFAVLAKKTTNDVDAAIAKTASSGLGKIHNLSAVDFNKSISLADATLVDVRTPKEFAASRIKGAINIDWYERTYKDLIQKLPKDKPVLIYCRSGNRTSKAASAMQALGFKNVYNLNKGIKDWKKSELPLEPALK